MTVFIGLYLTFSSFTLIKKWQRSIEFLRLKPAEFQESYHPIFFAQTMFWLLILLINQNVGDNFFGDPTVFDLGPVCSTLMHFLNITFVFKKKKKNMKSHKTKSLSSTKFSV